MNAQFKFKSTYLKLALIALTTALMTACGTSKSNPAASTTSTNSAFDFGSEKLLADCNKAKDSNFSISTRTVIDQTGQPSTDWIKLKFNFLSSTVTAAGNTIKFFKWRVVGTQAVMDNSPIAFATYDLNTGSTVGATASSIGVSQLSSAYGLYLQLNDPTLQFQVLKAVVYNSSGTIVAQINSLIPGFYASPLDYQYNSDGTGRSITLQQMHALHSQNMTGWTQQQMQQHFAQYCF